MTRTLFWLTSILLLGAALRVAGLGDQPLWIDEGFSYFAIKQPDLLTALLRDVHPPLYFLMLKGWVQVAGVSEFALRFPSVLLGVISVALMYRLAQEVVQLAALPDRRTMPLLAALLMALAEMGFYVSQEARSYSLHIALAILSMWAFLRWVRLGRRNWALIWIVSLTALVYTHYLGAWTGAVQFIYVMLFLRGRKRLKAVGLMAAAGLMFSVWLFAVVLPYQTVKADTDTTMDASTIDTLIGYAQSYLTHQWSLMLGLLALGLLDFRDGKPRLRPLRASMLFVLWIVAPVLLTFIGNLRFSILTNYRVSQIMIPLALLWAIGLASFRAPARTFLIAVVALYGVINVDFSRTIFPWSDYARMVSDYAIPGDVVLINFKGVDFSMEYYLDRQLPLGVQLESLRYYTQWDSAGLEMRVKLALAEASTVWLPRWNDESLAFDLLTSYGYVQTARRELNYQGITVETYRFDRLPEETLAEYENGMILKHAAVYPLRVDLWWSTSQPLDRDYTVSAFLLDETGRLVAQNDTQPMSNERPTSSWRSGSVIYDPRPLSLTVEHLPPGEYQVGVKVYLWRPRGIKDIPLSNGQEWALIGTVDR